MKPRLLFALPALLGAVIHMGAVRAAPWDAPASALRRGDYASAWTQLQPLAQAGLPEAQQLLGEVYAYGLGVERDFRVADQWFRRAAAQGHSEALSELGPVFDDGQGATPPYTDALRWYLLAARQGKAQAQYQVGVMLAKGHGAVPDLAAAYQWLRRAAAQGHHGAQTRLGLMYAEGQGVAQDDVLAYVWLSLGASSTGSIGAARRRDLLAQWMSPEQMARAKDLLQACRPADFSSCD